MESISHDIQDISDQSQVILRIKGIHDLLVRINIHQNILQQFQPKITIRTQLMPERPHNAVQYKVKLILIQRVQHNKIILDDSFQECEEI